MLYSKKQIGPSDHLSDKVRIVEKSHTETLREELSNVEERGAASPAAFSPAAFFKAPADSLDSIFSESKLSTTS
jgi:hypothetical protein